MKNVKELYRSKLHGREKSHDVSIYKFIVPGEQGLKLKMTYECYNANERFVGEHYVGGKLEHIFSMEDLGVTPDRTNYVCDSSKRLSRAEDLIQKGIKFFNTINQ
jgi:hypothetical protein